MKFRQRPSRHRRSSGFSLIEMMVVVVIVSIVVAAILTQVEQVQQRATAEQTKLDEFQDAQNFLDQITTDARQMGYPNFHNFDTSRTPSSAPSCGPAAWPSPFYDDCRLSMGLVEITPTQLLFEGDVDGSGKVSIVSYSIDGDGKCASCLERAQVYKSSATSGTSGAAYLAWDQGLIANAGYTAEIQNVQNSRLVFTAYDDTGTPIATPVDIGSNPKLLAEVRTIQVALDVSDPSRVDPKTKEPLEANITSRVQVVNCSMATSSVSQNGLQLTCQ